MSASLLDDLLSGFDGPPALHNAESPAAKAANSAKPEHSCGVAGDSTPCEGLRISAKAANHPADSTPDSQEFAGLRNPENVPQSEQPCGLSQDSQHSQGYPAQCAKPRTCADCRNRLSPGTCAEPVAAGLTPKYMLLWPPAGHAQGCPAFDAMPSGAAPDRPYRLSRAQGDAAHDWPWDDAVIARFQARAHRFERLGMDALDAEDLAERLHLRDVDGDERAICLECSHLAGRRCANYRAAGLAVSDLPASVAVTLQHCPGFTSGRAP